VIALCVSRVSVRSRRQSVCFGDCRSSRRRVHRDRAACRRLRLKLRTSHLRFVASSRPRSALRSARGADSMRSREGGARLQCIVTHGVIGRGGPAIVDGSGPCDPTRSEDLTGSSRQRMLACGSARNCEPARSSSGRDPGRGRRRGVTYVLLEPAGGRAIPCPTPRSDEVTPSNQEVRMVAAECDRRGQTEHRRVVVVRDIATRWLAIAAIS